MVGYNNVQFNPEIRPVLTTLRKYGLGRVLPVDHHTSFHKTCGVTTFALATVHTAMHLCNVGLNLAHANFGAFVAENGMEVRGLLRYNPTYSVFHPVCRKVVKNVLWEIPTSGGPIL